MHCLRCRSNIWNTHKHSAIGVAGRSQTGIAGKRKTVFELGWTFALCSREAQSRLGMPWIIFLLVFCGGVTAYEGRWCSRDDAAKVLAAWDQAMGIGGNGDTKKIIQKTSQFFLRLASDNPSVKPLFAKVNIDNPKSPEFQAHALRIATGLDLCVNALQNSRTLEAITSHLAMQHEARPGVTVEYFNAVRKYIDHNLPQLVDNLDLEAWDNCMTPIFNAITAQLP